MFDYQECLEGTVGQELSDQDLGPRSLAYDGEEMDLGCVLDALFYGQAATT